MIVTADRFLRPLFKVANITDGSFGVEVKAAEAGTWFLTSASRLMQAPGFFEHVVNKDGRVFYDPWQDRCLLAKRVAAKTVLKKGWGRCRFQSQSKRVDRQQLRQALRMWIRVMCPSGPFRQMASTCAP